MCCSCIYKTFIPHTKKTNKIKPTNNLSTNLPTICQTPVNHPCQSNTNTDRGGTTNLVTPTPYPQVTNNHKPVTTVNPKQLQHTKHTKHTYTTKPVPKPVLSVFKTIRSSQTNAECRNDTAARHLEKSLWIWPSDSFLRKFSLARFG